MGESAKQESRKVSCRDDCAPPCDSAWTKEDNAAISRHFARFQKAIETGELILDGRTNELGDKTFGIAIFEAKAKPPAAPSWKAIPRSWLA